MQDTGTLKTELDLGRNPQSAAEAQAAFRISFLGLMLAVVVSSLDQNIVSVALPHIATELGGIAYISWIVTAFLLMSTISAPVYGKLSDMYGRRSLLFVSMMIFLAASILCSVVQTMPQLIAARALQGLGAGGLTTLSQSAIGDLVGPRQRGRFQGYFTGALATSTVLGPLLGGAMISILSWRWIFLVTIPIGLISLALVKTGLRPVQAIKAHRIDYPGVALLAIGTCAALLFANSLESSFSSIPFFAVATGATTVVCLVLFLRQEKRAAEPLLDLTLFSNRSFVVGVVAAGMMTFAMNGAMVFLPLYFQLVQGQTPTHSGLMLLAQISGMIVSSIIGGRISARTGKFKQFFVAGVAMETLALAMLTVFALLSAGPGYFLVALAMLGLGTGLGMPNAIVVIQNSVPRNMLGIATASMSFLRSLGGAIGVALSGCLMHFTFNAILKANETARTDSIPTLDHQLSFMNSSVGMGGPHFAEALRFAIASSFAFGALMMLVALTTIFLKLPAQK